MNWRDAVDYATEHPTAAGGISVDSGAILAADAELARLREVISGYREERVADGNEMVQLREKIGDVEGMADYLWREDMVGSHAEGRRYANAFFAWLLKGG